MKVTFNFEQDEDDFQVFSDLIYHGGYHVLLNSISGKIYPPTFVNNHNLILKINSYFCISSRYNGRNNYGNYNKYQFKYSIGSYVNLRKPRDLIKLKKINMPEVEPINKDYINILNWLYDSNYKLIKPSGNTMIFINELGVYQIMEFHEYSKKVKCYCKLPGRHSFTLSKAQYMFLKQGLICSK